MNADRGIRNGNDICLTAVDAEFNYVKDGNPTAVIALRKASHNILYTVVNSRAYAPENLNMGMMGWQIAVIIIDIVLVIIAVFLSMKAWTNFNKRKILERKEAQSITANETAETETDTNRES